MAAQMPSEELEQNQRIGFDASFLDQWLRYQWLAWTIVFLVLLLGLLGLLGRGPFSTRTIRAGASGLEVHYERVAHFRTPAIIELRLPAVIVADAPLRIVLRGELVGKARYQAIRPQPVNVMPLPDGVIAEIRPDAIASARGKISIQQEPSGIGMLRSSIGLIGSPEVTLEQLVLP